MGTFHGVAQTQYGPKISFDNDKGKGVKQYDASPEALQQAQSMAPGTKIYAKWGKGATGYPMITGFTNEPPQQGGGKSGWKQQQYHPETFVSNVVGQAIDAGVIKDPSQIKPWADEAWTVIKTLQSSGQQSQQTQSPQQGFQQSQGFQQPQGQQGFGGNATVAGMDDFDDDIPFN